MTSSGGHTQQQLGMQTRALDAPDSLDRGADTVADAESCDVSRIVASWLGPSQPPQAESQPGSLDAWDSYAHPEPYTVHRMAQARSWALELANSISQ